MVIDIYMINVIISFSLGDMMEKLFTCTNKSYDNIGPRYISSSEELEKIEDTFINLRCYVDDYFAAVEAFENVKGKVINYFIVISEKIIIENYENLFDIFEELNDKNNILGLQLSLASKVGESDFKKLLNFLKNIQYRFDFRLNLANLEVFDNYQLSLLNMINSNLDTKLKVNQSYDGKFTENNSYDNLYSFDNLIKVKEKINEIISKIPAEYNEVEKILFVYKYLGKKIKYDKTMASLEHNNRKFYDSNSIYDILFNNKGVCSGIAVTFRVLMNAIGIECQVICSSKHEWNVVRINGFWYHLDLTWDLYNIKYNNKLEYFLKSEKYILKDESHQFYTFYAEKEEVAIRSIYSNKYTKRLI